MAYTSFFILAENLKILCFTLSGIQDIELKCDAVCELYEIKNLNNLSVFFMGLIILNKEKNFCQRFAVLFFAKYKNLLFSGKLKLKMKIFTLTLIA